MSFSSAVLRPKSVSARRILLCRRPIRPQRCSPRRSVLCASSKLQTSGKTQLQTLRDLSVVDADTGELELVKKYKTSGCTTNPSLMLKALQQKQYQYIIRQAIEEERADPSPSLPQRPYSSVADRVAVLLGCELLSIVPERISTQVDPHLSYDTDAILRHSMRLIELYEEKNIPVSNFYVKIPSTWEGIEACRQLQQKGIDCNMTLLFSFAQGVACGQAGAAMIAAYVGRIMDWYKAKTGKEYYSPEEDPGVIAVTRIYKYYKTYGMGTKVMAASFRNVDEVRQLSGCDHLTIGPAYLEQLESSTEPLLQKLSPDMGGIEDAEVKQMDEAFFREMHEADEMAAESLKVGVERFSADQRALEDIIANLVNE